MKVIVLNLVFFIVTGVVVSSETSKIVVDEFDLRRFLRVNTTSTCGEKGPEKFCYLTDLGFDKGHHCEFCDASSDDLSHPISNVIDDDSSSWWKSVNGQHAVTVVVDLRGLFYVSYVVVTMGPSPAPAAWLLERSTDRGQSFRPWQFFADTAEDCLERFGIAANLNPMTEDEVLCVTNSQKHLKDQEIFIKLIKGRLGASPSFASNRELQMWSTATTIRFRFLRLRTLGGEKIHKDDTVSQRHFYSIRNIIVAGHCPCHGHESRCLLDGTEIRCICEHNTCGPFCSECCPGYHHRPWAVGHPCQACNCYGHSRQCQYDETVARKRLSLDVNGTYSGGGVCLNCSGNTEGVNCERCKKGFYRTSSIMTPCQACDCDVRGSLRGRCSEVNGQCVCKPNFRGRSCNRCVPQHWDFPNCKPCDCHGYGSVDFDCHPVTGQCRCRSGMSGLRCNECASKDSQLLTSSGCLECGQCGLELYDVSKSELVPLTQSVHRLLAALTNIRHEDFVSKKLDFVEEQSAVLWQMLNMSLDSSWMAGAEKLLEAVHVDFAEFDILSSEVRRNQSIVGRHSMAVTFSATHLLQLVNRAKCEVANIDINVNKCVEMLQSLVGSDARNVTSMVKTPLMTSRAGQVRKRAIAEFQKAKDFLSTVKRHLWKRRRISTALSRLLNFTRASSGVVHQVSELNVKNWKMFRKQKEQSQELYDLAERLALPCPVTLPGTLSEDTFLNISTKTAELQLKSDDLLNLTTALEESSEWRDRVWTHVDDVLHDITSVSLLYEVLRPVQLAAEFAKAEIDSLRRIATTVKKIKTSLEKLKLEKISKGQGTSVQKQIAELEEVKQKTDETIKRANVSETRYWKVRDDVRFVSKKLQEQKSSIDSLLAYEPKRLKLPKIGVGNIDVLNSTFFEIAKRELDVKRRYGEVDTVTAADTLTVNRALQTGEKASNSAMELVRKINAIKTSETLLDKVKMQVAKLRSQVKHVYQLMHAYKVPMKFSGDDNGYLLSEDHLTTFALVTTLDVTLRLSKPTSFLLQLGLPNKGNSFLRFDVNDSHLVITIKHGVDFLTLKHPVTLSLRRWYRVELTWLVDTVDVAVSLVGSDYRSNVRESFRVLDASFRSFVPGVLWIGQHPRTEMHEQPVPDPGVCFDNVYVNAFEVATGSVWHCSGSSVLVGRKLDVLWFDGTEVVYLEVPSTRQLSMEFYLRTIQRNAVVLTVHLMAKTSLVVMLQDGRLHVEISGNQSSATVSADLQCNDGRSHHVQVVVTFELAATVSLTLNRVYRDSRKLWIVDDVMSWMFYLGGSPQKLLNTNFQGYILDFRIGNKSLLSSSNFSTAMVTPVHLLGRCICGVTGAVRLKPLGFRIQMLAVSFSLRDMLANSTVLYYASSSKSGVAVNVFGQHPSFVTVSFWSGSFRKTGIKRVLKDTRWHLLTLHTDASSVILSVDDVTWKTSDMSLLQERYYTAQHQLLLGGKQSLLGLLSRNMTSSVVCYKDLILNSRLLDMTPYVLSSGATACPVL